jgi:DNA repair protein RecO (recombination protein O)
MPAYTTDAFVLRRMQYGETDNILALYSRDRGRFSAIAKGARKAVSRLSGATETLTRARFGLASGKSLEIITQVEVQDAYRGLRRDLNRLAHGLYLADLVDHSVEDHAPNPPLFDLLEIGLAQLLTADAPEIVARWFELHLLRDLGYAPQIWTCAVCQAAVPGQFALNEMFGLSVQLGGALCPRHAHPESYEDHSGLSHAALTLLQTLASSAPDTGVPWETLAMPNAKGLNQARLALRRSLRVRLERDLKSLEFLDSLRPG